MHLRLTSHLRPQPSELEGGGEKGRPGERIAGPGEGPRPIGQPVAFVTISDTGSGMPPEVLDHIFEPFFTTKEVGTVLGLSMVYGFAQQSGGHVFIESELGRGTSVTIMLPAIDTQAMQLADAGAPLLAKGAKEKILVVENEPQVLQFFSSQLISLGYRVEAVSSGPDALNLLRRDKNFDLLFTDVVPPKGMSGVELA